MDGDRAEEISQVFDDHRPRTPPPEHWHVDKRIPVAVLVIIVLQTAGAFWWASAINTRVGQLEREYVSVSPQAGQIIRLQTQLDSISANVADIKNALIAQGRWPAFRRDK